MSTPKPDRWTAALAAIAGLVAFLAIVVGIEAHARLSDLAREHALIRDRLDTVELYSLPGHLRVPDGEGTEAVGVGELAP